MEALKDDIEARKKRNEEAIAWVKERDAKMNAILDER